MTDSSDRLDMIEPALAKDPMLSTLAKDPIEPMDRAEPTEPMLSTELRDPMDSSELVEPMLQRDVDRGVVDAAMPSSMPSSCRYGDPLLAQHRGEVSRA